VAGEVDVLVSTLIVESGLDVPNANTMFVNRADHFGLAQLYQLRGRVGRSHRRAYCYLIVPDQIDEDAERRLQVLEHHTELGSRAIASRSRTWSCAGRGTCSGPSSPASCTPWASTSTCACSTRPSRMQRGDDAPPPPPADVSLDSRAPYLPDDYIPSQEVKLDVYRRLTAPPDGRGHRRPPDEVRDRFGPLPPPAEAYFALARLRLLGAPLGSRGSWCVATRPVLPFAPTRSRVSRGSRRPSGRCSSSADVRRVQPLSLKLTRLGGATLLDGLVRALRTISPDAR
jgi:transcription-repair coupling factor (superfamily II helicase)